MKIRLITGLMLFMSCLMLQANPQAEIDKANKAYIAGFFENSIAIYEKVIAEGLSSPELYYNLGNAYFKTNNLPSAILNYERALKFDPGNEDIIFNLGVANSRIVDKIEVLPELFYIRWWKDLKTMFSPDAWAAMAIASFAALFIVIAIFLLTRTITGRKIFFVAGLLILIINILSDIIAWKTYTALQKQITAIVFTPTLPVKSSPDESSIDLFVIHEGLKVTIIDKLGVWNEISIANGSKGWVKTNDLKPI